jgi:death-on-curing protein
MESSLLSYSEILVIHQLLLDRFGGMPGITETGFGRLEAAVAAPELSMFGDDLYPGVLDKASILFYLLARAHAFSDGNKRVALLALIEFLSRHGMMIAAGPQALYEFVMSTASDRSREDVFSWIAAHVQPLESS